MAKRRKSRKGKKLTCVKSRKSGKVVCGTLVKKARRRRRKSRR